MSYFHVWFLTKYSKAVLEGDVERKVKDYFLEVADNKNYNILEMETNKDHVHMLLEAKDREELAGMVRVLKSVSAKKILLDTPHLRVGNARCSEGYHRRKPVEVRGNFWARCYGCREVSKNEIETVKTYIRDQKKTVMVGG
ncbi:MAG: IS200/IS605 family transposase [Candidatus Omnitrophota bacterium]